MPYIKQNHRLLWGGIIGSVVTKICKEIKLDTFGAESILYDFVYFCATMISEKVGKGRYRDYERAYGMLGCLTREYNRRHQFDPTLTEVSNWRSWMFGVLQYRTKTFSGYFSKKVRLLSQRFITKAGADVLGGQFNYCISALINKLLADSLLSREVVKLILVHVMADFYTQKIAPYEDLKKQENGDVFLYKPKSQSRTEREVCYV